MQVTPQRIFSVCCYVVIFPSPRKPPCSQNVDYYFAFGQSAQDGFSNTAPRAPGESSNESAGETLDVEGLGGTAGGLGAGRLGAMPGEAQSQLGVAGATAAGMPRGRGSRGIGIGIGVAAGAATAHRGVKRELSDTTLPGAAGGYGKSTAWGGVGSADITGRSMSEQQKLERRVSFEAMGCVAVTFSHGQGTGWSFSVLDALIVVVDIIVVLVCLPPVGAIAPSHCISQGGMLRYMGEAGTVIW